MALPRSSGTAHPASQPPAATMSVIRPRPPEDPLEYVGASPEGRGHGPGHPAERLAAIRASFVAEPGGLDLPRRMLAEYDTRRPESRLFAILSAARRIRDTVDRLVIVAGGTIGPATRLVAATCCHPFHAQLSRGERGGRPRLSWLDGRTGNDALQGLLDLVAPPGGPRHHDLLERWSLLTVEASGADPRQLGLEAILLERLRASLGAETARLAERVVPIASAGDGDRILGGLDCPIRFPVEAELHSAGGVFTAGGLLPAAVVGVDVVQLLKGAAAMLQRCAEAPPAENPALIDGAVAFEAARSGNAPGRLFLGDGPWLPALGEWQAAVRPTPPGVAAVVTRLAAGSPRRERIVDPPAGDVDATIRLPRVDEHAIGQLIQLLLLSVAVEKQLGKAV